MNVALWGLEMLFIDMGMMREQAPDRQKVVVACCKSLAVMGIGAFLAE